MHESLAVPGLPIESRFAFHGLCADVASAALNELVTTHFAELLCTSEGKRGHV